MAQIIDGRQLAAKKKEELKGKSHDLRQRIGRAPCLAVIQVGNDPASDIYVGRKIKMCADLGIASVSRMLGNSITQSDLHSVINELNRDDSVDGILLQLPLPAHLDRHLAVPLIDPAKDVDGLHPHNQGLLFQGRPRFVPCTPQGCLQLIQSVCDSIDGARAVVVGRSILVGRPMAALLNNHDATVTLAHIRTHSLRELCQSADILVVAVGHPGLITANHIKPGAIVIDVGITRTDHGIVGDVDFASVEPKASFITPVPGGVGPMTIVNLMHNVLHAFELKENK